MSLESPNKTLFNSDGYETIVKDGNSLLSHHAGLLVAGSNESDGKYISLDTYGRQLIAGVGISGSPNNQVVSIQGAHDGDNIPIMGHVDIDNFPSDLSVVQDDASELNSNVGGLGASNAANVGKPVRLGAKSSENTFDILTDSSGRLKYVGAADAGNDVSGAPLLLGGSDGTNIQNILSDSDGHIIRVGAADAGSALIGAPVQLSGSDSEDTKSILTDSTGRLLFSGAASNNTAVLGNPVRLAGSDSADTRDLLTDTAGRLIRVGAAASGSAPVGNPVLAAGWDGTNVQIFKLDSFGAVQVNNVKPAYATFSSVNVNQSSTLLLEENSDREGALIFNDSNRPLYIKLGSAASTNNFTIKLGAQTHYEVPSDFIGSIYGLWNDANASGSARITELTTQVPIASCLTIQVNGSAVDPGAETEIVFLGSPSDITLTGTGDYSLYSGGPSDPAVFISSGSVSPSSTIYPDIIGDPGSYHIVFAESGCPNYTFYFTV